MGPFSNLESKEHSFMSPTNLLLLTIFFSVFLSLPPGTRKDWRESGEIALRPRRLIRTFPGLELPFLLNLSAELSVGVFCRCRLTFLVWGWMSGCLLLAFPSHSRPVNSSSSTLRPNALARARKRVNTLSSC